MESKPTWYAVKLGRTYHAESADWVRTGTAICGAEIKSPAVFWWPDGEVPTSKPCKRCLDSLDYRLATRLSNGKLGEKGVK